MADELTRRTAFARTDEKALLRDSLAQCCGEALALLRRAEQEPEHARQYTELARKLMRTCADLIAALNATRRAQGAGISALSNPGTIRTGRKRKRRKRA
jgi:hypothetical protein